MSKLARKHFLCFISMLVLCVGNVLAQSVVDFGTNLYSTKYWESMNASNPPAGTWYDVDYDDSGWNTYTNPLNFPTYDAFWVRRSFIITDDPANHQFQLKHCHDDETVIYINGHAIHDHYNPCGRYYYVDIPSEYLVNGHNVLAAYVYDSGGGSQFLECFISAKDGSDIISDLPSEPIFFLSQSDIYLYTVSGYSEDSLRTKLITPNGIVDAQVTWTSSNPAIVDVTDGHLMALSAGNAVVTATTVYDGITYSKECAVQVRAIAQGSKLVIVDEPGTLGSLLTDAEKDNIDNLTIFGKLNAGDVQVLRYMAGRDADCQVSSGVLADLDIYNVEFVSDNSTFRATNGSSLEFNGAGFHPLSNCSVSQGSLPIEMFWDCAALKSIVLPRTITKIGSGAFFRCTSLESITIPQSVAVIESNVFNGCSSLTSLVIPDAVTNIADHAYSNCPSLTSINIPDGVTSIGGSAFEYNSQLTTITIPDGVTSIGSYAFNGCSSLTSITIEGNSVADYNAFKQLVNYNALIYIDAGMYDAYNNTSGWVDINRRIISQDMLDLQTVNLTADPNKSSLFTLFGNNSNYVGNLKIKGTINGYDIMALRNKCIHLLYLDLSEADIVANDGGYEYYTGCSLKADNELGDHSFAELNLKKVVLPNSLISIGNTAFQDCPFLEEVVIKGNTRSIGNSAFNNCRWLRSANMPESILTIGESAFRYCGSLGPNIRIPNRVTTINPYTFYGCGSIDTLYIGDNVVNIAERAFYNCSRINTIHFNRKLLDIGYQAFYGCSSLLEAKLPFTVENIGQEAFYGCRSLTYIEIPSMAKTIGEKAFNDCGNIVDVYTFTIEPTQINQYTFNCYTKAMLHVPRTSANTYIYNTQWSQFFYVNEFSQPYYSFYLIGDLLLGSSTERLQGKPDLELYPTSGIVVEGSEVQELNGVEMIHDGTNAAAIIGSADDVTGDVVNLTANSLKINISVEANKWYFLSFPFIVERDSIECSSEYVFYSYDGAKRASTGSGWTKMPSDFSQLEKGTGYIFQTSSKGFLTIKVVADYIDFRAIQERELLYSFTADDASNAHWNFVGNPYLSYYDINDLVEFDSPIIVWNGRGYDVYKPGDDDYKLKPFEAFFVQKELGVSYIDFLPEHRITYNQSLIINSQHANMRRASKSLDRQLVNIVISGKDSISDRTRIVYSKNASMDYEIGTDAAKFQSDGIPQIYTLNNGIKYAINERPMGKDEIHIGYSVPAEGEYTLSLTRDDADVCVVDRETGLPIDFSLGNYTFTSKGGTYNDRFVVYMLNGGATAVDNIFRLDGMTITSFDGGIDIEGLIKDKVSIYNESGQMVAEPTHSGRILLDDGTYIIKTGGKSIKMDVR